MKPICEERNRHIYVICIKMEDVELTERDMACIKRMKLVGDFTNSVIYNPELNMDDIKLRAEEWGLGGEQKLFDFIQEIRAYLREEKRKNFINSVIHDPELSMDDITFKAEEWRLEGERGLFETIQEIRNLFRVTEVPSRCYDLRSSVHDVSIPRR